MGLMLSTAIHAYPRHTYERTIHRRSNDRARNSERFPPAEPLLGYHLDYFATSRKRALNDLEAHNVAITRVQHIRPTVSDHKYCIQIERMSGKDIMCVRRAHMEYVKIFSAHVNVFDEYCGWTKFVGNM